jgi:TRAP-type C4-dicarboxylate transport system permease small subunit
MGSKRTERIIKTVDRTVAGISCLAGAVGFCLIGLVILVNIIGRFVLPDPPQGLIEISESVLVAAVFLSLSYTQLLGGHVRMETVLSRLPSKVQCILNVVVLLLVLALGILLSWRIGEAAYINWATQASAHSTTVNLPFWPRDLCAFIGAVFLATSFLTQLLRNLIGLLNGWKVVGLKTWGS